MTMHFKYTSFNINRILFTDALEFLTVDFRYYACTAPKVFPTACKHTNSNKTKNKKVRTNKNYFQH